MFIDSNKYFFSKKTFLKKIYNKNIFYSIFVFVCFFNFILSGNLAIAAKNNTNYIDYINNEETKGKQINRNEKQINENEKQINGNEKQINENKIHEQKKNNKISNFLYFFAKKYIVTDENQIFIKNKHAISVSYGVSVNRDRKGTLQNEFDSNPWGREFERDEGFIEYDPEKQKYYQYSWNGDYRYRGVGVTSLHYSIPDSFLNLNGRLSIGFMSWNGLNKEYNKRFGASGIELIQEIIIGSPMLYITAGIGPSYIFPLKHYNKHVNMSSQFYFSLVANIGHRFKNGTFVEIGWHHYSNGELNTPNYGLNFIKITVGYTF